MRANAAGAASGSTHDYSTAASLILSTTTTILGSNGDRVATMTKRCAQGRAPRAAARGRVFATVIRAAFIRTVGVGLTLIGAALGVVLADSPADAQETLRVGHFPNITHIQALVARQLERQGKNWFAERLGKDVKIEWYAYNAGPSAMEAFFVNAIDLTYVGPNPALNAFVRSRGEEVRIVSGAVNGGSALVVQKDSGLTKPADFRGKRIGRSEERRVGNECGSGAWAGHCKER